MQDHRFLFSQLSDQDVDWMAGNGHPRWLLDGEQIIHPNAELTTLFILLRGRLSVLVDHHSVSLLRPGEIIGEMSLIDARPTSASVIAAGPAWVLELDKAAIVARLAANTGFAARFYRAVALALSDRLRSLQARPPDPMAGRGSDHLRSAADARFARLVEAVR